MAPTKSSPDGTTLAYRVESSTRFFNSNTNAHDLWTLSLTDGENPKVLSAPQFPSVDLGASFSADGRWVVYSSGRALDFALDVYVEPFPATGEKRLISQGAMPLWSPAGDELFYRPVTNVAQQQSLRSVGVSTDPTLSLRSEQVIPVDGFLSVAFYRSFDATSDGQRFLVVLPAEEPDSGPAQTRSINVVLNWFEELKERVPVP